MASHKEAAHSSTIINTNNQVSSAGGTYDAEMEAAVQDYLAQARPLDGQALPHCRANTDTVLRNMSQGAQELTAPESRAIIREQLPSVDQSLIADAPRLGMALNYVAHKLTALVPEVAGSKQELARARKFRRQLVKTLASAVEWNIIPQTALEELRRGNRRADVAHDIVNAIALLDAHKAQLDGKTLVTAQMKVDAMALASRMLKGQDAKKSKSPQVAERDQLYALAIERYELMRKAGFWVWGEALDKHVPPLRSAPKHAKKPSTSSDATAQSPTAPAVNPVAPTNGAASNVEVPATSAPTAIPKIAA